ncbi:MAG: pyridoxamine 5'-phosphate oxidase [Acidobacteria bacterium]|nr:pyridoxamine 5'-phosphate oxidase [Acidobacteriota bacterium]
MSDLLESTANPNPIEQFRLWWDESLALGEERRQCMSLATIGDDGAPATRVVLLKQFDHRGFVFYTNYGSRKARELDRDPRAALVIHWFEQAHQVRVEGRAERTSREESKTYFAMRPRGSQLGAWASEQSAVIGARDVLDRQYAEAETRFNGVGIPCPHFWGGYRVVPHTVEFWQGQQSRLHDRLRYTRDGKGWRVERLAP